MPGHPVPIFGWGAIPDQYGRRWEHDDLEDDASPADPRGSDLPPLRRWWGTTRGG